MKKLLLLTALALPVAAPAFADTYEHYNYEHTSSVQKGNFLGMDYSYDPARHGSFTGPYFGGTVDYNWTDGDSRSTTAGVGTTGNPSQDGFQGGVLAGYGFQFDPRFLSSIWSGYMAAEIAYEWNGSDGDTAGGVNFEKNEGFSATLRPGITFGNTALGYGIVGYTRSQFDVGADDKWLDGYSVGAGTELATFGPLKTRIEYVYTNYESENFASGTGTTTKFDPYDNTIKLGAVFHF